MMYLLLIIGFILLIKGADFLLMTPHRLPAS